LSLEIGARLRATQAQFARGAARASTERRVCVIGSGTRFLSGISVYTCRLANALAESQRTSVILMRQLLPSRLYPGQARVGASLQRLEYSPSLHVFNGVDWYWMPSLVRALLFLFNERPTVVVCQWWSGTVLHSYLVLAMAARILGARVVIEFHEVLDPGEAGLPFVGGYVRVVAPWLVRLASAFVVHSSRDQALVEKHYRLATRPLVIPHGPYDHYGEYSCDGPPAAERIAPAECCNLLFFGVIRPYKGLEDLLAVFEDLPEEEAKRYWLTVVGETWEGWELPARLIARSRYRDRITFVNRYVHDDEVGAYFAAADAVVLPYRRASMSGPLHIGMASGLPVVVSDVGGHAEAVANYAGAVLVPPADLEALHNALTEVANMRGTRFTDPHSWEHISGLYDQLFATLSQPSVARETA